MFVRGGACHKLSFVKYAFILSQKDDCTRQLHFLGRKEDRDLSIDDSVKQGINFEAGINVSPVDVREIFLVAAYFLSPIF